MQDEAQVAEIEQAYTDYSERTTASTIGTAKPNLIFIIVESYLSQTSDLKVDGKEITPFLNRLKRDSTVYYNGQMQPNINIGESSDGQFIDMTGVLPLILYLSLITITLSIQMLSKFIYVL